MFGNRDVDADGPTFDAESGTYELTYDAADGEEIVVEAIRSVAEVAGISPFDIEPLYESVDTDALVSVLEAAEANRYVADGIELRIHGYDVTIGGGRIVITPPTGAGPRRGR
jgi:hypothetical protein